MKLQSRKKLMLSILFSVALIALVLILSFCLGDHNLNTNSQQKSLSPNAEHLLGTDWLGRDMLTRIVKGLRFSMMVGLTGAFIGVAIAVILGVMAATMGKKVDTFILWLIDLFIGMPHLVFLVLISIAVGRGATGVIIGTALTHWPALARLVRNEIFNVIHLDYINISRNIGKGKLYVVKNHLLPVILPQLMVGFLLLFPHVILHEASMTFLGFGLSAQSSSIGIILSEAVKHIVLGDWWLAVFPGAMLVLLVKSFDSIGESARQILDPQTSYS